MLSIFIVEYSNITLEHKEEESGRRREKNTVINDLVYQFVEIHQKCKLLIFNFDVNDLRRISVDMVATATKKKTLWISSFCLRWTGDDRPGNTKSPQRTPIGQRKHKNNIESSQMVVGIGKLRQIEMVPDCLYISDSAFHVNCVAHNALQMPAVIHYLRAVHFHY